MSSKKRERKMEKFGGHEKGELESGDTGEFQSVRNVEGHPSRAKRAVSNIVRGCQKRGRVDSCFRAVSHAAVEFLHPAIVSRASVYNNICIIQALSTCPAHSFFLL